MVSEGFEGGAFPSAWSRYTVLGDTSTYGWQLSSRAHNGSASLFHTYQLSGFEDSWLVSPRFTPTSASQLKFWQYQRYPLDFHSHQVLVSSASPDPKDYQYTLLAGLPVGPGETWQEVTLDLSAYAGQSISVAFRYQGQQADEWFLDDISVTTALQALYDGPTVLGATTTFTAAGLTGSDIVYTWDFGDGSGPGAGQTVTHVYAAPGPYTAHLTAEDGSGAPLSTTFTVQVDQPGAGLDAGSNSPVLPGSPVDFTASLSAGSNLNYHYDFGDGSAPVEGLANPSHTYATGAYSATLTVTNSVSILTATLPVVVEAPITGLAAGSDAPTSLGATTTFTSSLSTGDLVEWTWSFGDGTTGAGPAPQHTYTASGFYVATVTAANARGQASASTMVTVAVPPGRPLLSESFESGTFPPAGWGQFSGRSTNTPWRESSERAHSPTRAAFHDSADAEQDAWLVSPAVIPGPSSALTFWQSENRSWLYRGHSVWVLTDGQNPKDNLPVLLADLGPGQEDAWQALSLDLSPWAGQTIWLAFRYQGAGADQWWLDDIEVTSALSVASSTPTLLGASTVFTASLPTGTHLTYDWDFGDGQTLENGPTASHAYAQAGTYTATLTAHNGLDTRTASTRVEVLAANLGLSLSASPTLALAGRPLAYTLTVSNAGPFPAPQTVLTATLPGGFILDQAQPAQGSCQAAAATLTCSLDTLPAGAAVPVLLSGSAAPSLVHGQLLALLAETASAIPDPSLPDNQADLNLTALTAADLLLSLQPAAAPRVPGTLVPGAQVTYGLTVTNYRPSDARAVVVTGTLPAEAALAGWSANPGEACTSAGAAFACHFGELPAGASVSAAFRLQLDPAARAGLHLSARVTSQDPDPDPANNQVDRLDPLSPQADLGLARSAYPAQLFVGSDLPYTLTVTNAGPSLATSLTVVESLPPGVEVLSLPPACQAENRAVRCELGALPVGESHRLAFRLRSHLSQGQLATQAEASAQETDPNPGDNSAALQIQALAELQVYSLAGAPGPEWSLDRRGATPSGRTFLGEYSNETVRLALAGLPAHSWVRLRFDLFLLRSWDGNLDEVSGDAGARTGRGPDRWSLRAAGQTLLATTFSNWGPENSRQAFPGSYPGGDYPAQTGAAASGSLGYSYPGQSHMDSTYQLEYAFPHTGPDLQVAFEASGLQEIQDESWGLAKVEVWVASPQWAYLPSIVK